MMDEMLKNPENWTFGTQKIICAKVKGKIVAHPVDKFYKLKLHRKPYKMAEGIPLELAPGFDPIDFTRYTVDSFPWANLDRLLFGGVGCGFVMLAQITHTNPFEVKRFLTPIILKYYPEEVVRPNNMGVPAMIMSLFLGMFGINMIPLSEADISTKKKTFSRSLKETHVVMAKIPFGVGETSWFAFHGGMTYHNCDPVYKTPPLDLLEHPPQKTYLLYKKSWAWNGHAAIEGTVNRSSSDDEDDS